MSTNPHCVYVTSNPDDETYEQVVKRQEKFLQLPEKIQDILLSKEVAKKIQRIGQQYHLSLFQMASIARLIRGYYFGEIKKNDFAKILVQEMKIDLQRVEEISKYIIASIIETDITTIKTNPKIKLSIQQALEKYPKIRKQLVSVQSMEIIGQQYPVKGTIGNWIKDYYNVVGAGNYDIMKRSGYLYNSKNTKALNVEEKQKLAFLLKALEKNSIVEVDVNKNEIIFKIKKNLSFRNRIGTDNEIDDLQSGQASNSQNNFEKPEKKGEKRQVENYFKQVENIQFKKTKNDLLEKNKTTETKVKHIQGNNWNLKSNQFQKNTEKSEKKRSVIKKIFKKHNKQSIGKGEFLERKKIVDKSNNLYSKKNTDSKIKFSSPQQFPVEKVRGFRPKNKYLPKFNETKISEKKNTQTEDDFFGKISPIDD